MSFFFLRRNSSKCPLNGERWSDCSCNCDQDSHVRSLSDRKSWVLRKHHDRKSHVRKSQLRKIQIRKSHVRKMGIHSCDPWLLRAREQQQAVGMGRAHACQHELGMGLASLLGMGLGLAPWLGLSLGMGRASPLGMGLASQRWLGMAWAHELGKVCLLGCALGLSLGMGRVSQQWLGRELGLRMVPPWWWSPA